MPITISLTRPITDSVARDLTRFRMAQYSAVCTLTETLDAATQSVKLSSLQGVKVGSQIATGDGELMTVTALPTDVPNTVTVTRGDSSVLTSTGAAGHLTGTTCYVLKYPNLEDMLQEFVNWDIQRTLMAMGSLSETYSGVVGGL